MIDDYCSLFVVRVFCGLRPLPFRPAAPCYSRCRSGPRRRAMATTVPARSATPVLWKVPFVTVLLKYCYTTTVSTIITTIIATLFGVQLCLPRSNIRAEAAALVPCHEAPPFFGQQ